MSSPRAKDRQTNNIISTELGIKTGLNTSKFLSRKDFILLIYQKIETAQKKPNITFGQPQDVLFAVA